MSSFQLLCAIISFYITWTTYQRSARYASKISIQHPSGRFILLFQSPSSDVLLDIWRFFVMATGNIFHYFQSSIKQSRLLMPITTFLMPTLIFSRSKNIWKEQFYMTRARYAVGCCQTKDFWTLLRVLNFCECFLSHNEREKVRIVYLLWF